MCRKSSSPLGTALSSFSRIASALSLSQYLGLFLGLGAELFRSRDESLKDARDMLRPLEKNARLAFSFLSNSFWSRTLLSGGVGPDLEGVRWGKGGVGTSLMIIFSGSSSLGDKSCLDPCDGLEIVYGLESETLI